MATLFELCSLIRSKNAGPFVLTRRHASRGGRRAAIGPDECEAIDALVELIGGRFEKSSVEVSWR